MSPQGLSEIALGQRISRLARQQGLTLKRLNTHSPWLVWKNGQWCTYAADSMAALAKLQDQEVPHEPRAT